MHHVKAAAEQNYTGTMIGSSVVPPTDSAATGLVIMRHDDHAMHWLSLFCHPGHDAILLNQVTTSALCPAGSSASHWRTRRLPIL